MGRIRTFVEGGWSLWTLHGGGHGVYGGGRPKPKCGGVTRLWAGPMDFGRDCDADSVSHLDPGDDDPKIFVSCRSASSD